MGPVKVGRMVWAMGERRGLTGKHQDERCSGDANLRSRNSVNVKRITGGRKGRFPDAKTHSRRRSPFQ